MERFSMIGGFMGLCILKSCQIAQFKYGQIIACHLYLIKTLKMWFTLKFGFSTHQNIRFGNHTDSTISLLRALAPVATKIDKQ